MATKSTAESFQAAVLLWCASWHQLPAGSLPDDDHELANLAGFGRVVKEWQRLREGALHGWIHCSDGRLYHPHIAKIAMEAWAYKLQYSYRKACDRIRKAHRAVAGSANSQPVIPTFEAWSREESARLSTESAVLSGGKSKRTPGNPAESALKESKRSEAKRSETNRTINPTPTPQLSPPLKLPDWLPPEIWAVWLKYRGKSYTEHAMELSLKKLARFHAEGQDVVAVIEQSIEAEWTGLFSLKNQGQKNQKGHHRESKSSVLDDLTGRNAGGPGPTGRTYEHKP